MTHDRVAGDRLFRVEIRRYQNGLMIAAPDVRHYGTYSQFVKYLRDWTKTCDSITEAQKAKRDPTVIYKTVAYQFDDATDEWKRYEGL